MNTYTETIKIVNKHLGLRLELICSEQMANDYHKTIYEIEHSQLHSISDALTSFLLDEGFLMKSRVWLPADHETFFGQKYV